MTTPQENASLALARWQQLKRRYPDPGDRMDALDYQDQLNAVDKAMQERPIDWTIARDWLGMLAFNFGMIAVLGIIGWEIFRP